MIIRLDVDWGNYFPVNDRCVHITMLKGFTNKRGPVCATSWLTQRVNLMVIRVIFSPHPRLVWPSDIFVHHIAYLCSTVGIYRISGSRRYRTRIDLEAIECSTLGVVSGHLCTPNNSLHSWHLVQCLKPSSVLPLVSQIPRRSGVTGSNVLAHTLPRSLFTIPAPRKGKVEYLIRDQSHTLAFKLQKEKYPFHSAQPYVARGQ